VIEQLAAARALQQRARMNAQRSLEHVLDELDAESLEAVAGGASESAPAGGGYTVTPPVGNPYTVIRDLNQLTSLKRWDAQFGKK
jgi:hypothetical protein